MNDTTKQSWAAAEEIYSTIRQREAREDFICWQAADIIDKHWKPVVSDLLEACKRLVNAVDPHPEMRQKGSAVEIEPYFVEPVAFARAAIARAETTI